MGGTRYVRLCLRDGRGMPICEAAPSSTACRPLSNWRARAYWFVSNNWELVKRSLRHIRRDPDQVSVTVQPLILVIAFRYFFGGAVRTGGTESYINFLMAGIFIETAAISSTTTATSVAADMAEGVMERFRVLPMAKSAVLASHTVAGLARSLIGTVVMVGAGLAVGFRPSAGVGPWAVAIGVTLLVTFSLSWVAAVLGLLARSVEAVQQIAMVLVIPIFASSAFVPTRTMPGWVQVVVVNQPMTQAIDAVRDELLDLPVGDHLGLALAWFGAILVAAFGTAGYLLSRRASL